MSILTFDQLHTAVSGNSVALRSKTSLQPAGGKGDKIFPPSYVTDNNAKHKYVIEERTSKDGAPTTTVLLDSVASQANRAEMALLEGYERKEIFFPVPYVDFTEYSDLTDYKRITVLEAPHRLADAIFRDSLLDGTLFRLSEVGRAITDSTTRNAISMFRHSPTSLLFGLWDATGPKGGSGSKFQRAYVSEIVGFGASVGRMVRSRIDPLQIEKVASSERVFNSADPREVWTDVSDNAKKDAKGKPEYASRGGASGEAGQPSKINHGNIPPTIDAEAGGVTISEGLQTTLISFAALRRLRFGNVSREAEAAARTAIAALGVAAIAYQHEMDYDLRSRCLLLPTHSPRIELLGRDGSAGDSIDIDRGVAADILKQAAAHAEASGIGWETKDVRLAPAPKLIELIRRSRKVTAVEQPANDHVAD